MSSPSTRKQCDFTKLVLHGYEVELKEESTQDFYVTFKGPKDTLYEDAIYRVHVELPDQYPFASPSIGFEPFTIFHPNIDERSGSVCLDVINQTWTPLYSLVNVFETFLPQLLTYPNPGDPLNGEASSLYVKDTKKYEERVDSYVQYTIQLHKSRQAAKKEAEEKAAANAAEKGVREEGDQSQSHPHEVGNNSPTNNSSTSAQAAAAAVGADQDNANNRMAASSPKEEGALRTDPQASEETKGTAAADQYASTGGDQLIGSPASPLGGGWNDFEMRDDDDLDVEFD